MRPSRVRHRIRLRFTVWRLLAAMACFALALGLVHDVEYLNGDTVFIHLAALIGMLAMAVLAAIGIGGQVVKIGRALSGRSSRRRTSPGPGGNASSDLNQRTAECRRPSPSVGTEA